MLSSDLGSAATSLAGANEVIEGRRPMTAFGPKQTSPTAPHMSALGCEADVIAISAIASPAKQKTRHKAGYVRRGKLKLTAGLTAPAPSQASGGKRWGVARGNRAP